MEDKEEEIVEESQEEEPKEAIKEVVKIKMPKEQAREEWKKYVDVLKTRKEKYLQTMKQAMYHMKEGRELVDIYKVMKQAGLNENNEPRLARWLLIFLSNLIYYHLTHVYFPFSCNE